MTDITYYLVGDLEFISFKEYVFVILQRVSLKHMEANKQTEFLIIVFVDGKTVFIVHPE